jgi:serine/threonine-protein kinase
MEASLLAEMKHPRLIKMIRFFSEARRLYIVLEKIDGPSLRQLVKTREDKLKEEEVVDIAIQICEALEYLHSQVPPVLHRDISPDNLLLD